MWMGTTTRVGNAFGQNGVLKGPGRGIYSSLGWGVAVCLCLGWQQVLICSDVQLSCSFSGTL